MTPLYAIGDIHGQRDMLEGALERISADGGPEARIVFLGDYCDRGPDTRGVMDILATGMAEGRNWVCLKGNHDRMFEWFMEDAPRHDPHLLVGYHWLHERIGGLETLESYGVTFPDRTRLKDVHAMAKDAVPQSHVDLLRKLDLSHGTDRHFFVHAGIRPGVALDAQEEEDLVWIRDAFHMEAAPHPKIIVHGHTPVDQATHYGNRVNLDSGAGYGKPLSVAYFEGDTCFLLTPNGRELLRPKVG